MHVVAEAVWHGGHRPLVPPAGVSPVDWFAQVPGAVYTATATVHGHRVLGLDAHLDRLLGSLATPPLRPQDLRRALASALSRFGPGEARVLLEVFPCPVKDPRGATGAVVLWPARSRSVARHAEGVRVALAPGAARVDPATKHSAWRRQREVHKTDALAYEHLLVDEGGHLLEGFTSNLLGVRDQVVFAPCEGILLGLTRRALLACAAARGLTVEERPLPLSALPQLDELGLCSCGRGLVPVSRVGQQTIGTGRPGPVVAALHQDWLALRRQQAQPVEP